MCGITGVVGSRPNPEVLVRMGQAIAHRGPNDASETVFDEAGFAFRRLSIIDVTGGQQPIWNERHDVAILLNGEIYNHLQLRAGLEERGHRFGTRSDVESVLHLWEEKGADCLADLRGMFALAIWDTRTSSLLLARDRLGKKPLYYSEVAGGLVFGSEIKAILQHPAVQREPNVEALELFLSLHYVPTPVTAFVGIQRLPPGSWLCWRSGRLELGRYWDLAYGNEAPTSESELRAETLRLLRESVAIRLESEVPLGAFLSGGLDSSTVVALAAEASSKPLKTFSIGFGAQSFDESGYARLVSRQFGTDHHELRLDEAPTETIQELARQFDQPFGDSSAIPTLQVAKITKPFVTVVLTGDGGDETFAGYDRYRLARLARYFALPQPILQGIYTAAGPFGRFLGRAERLLRGRPNSLAEAYMVTLFQPVSLSAGTAAGDKAGDRRAFHQMDRDVFVSIVAAIADAPQFARTDQGEAFRNHPRRRIEIADPFDMVGGKSSFFLELLACGLLDRRIGVLVADQAGGQRHDGGIHGRPELLDEHDLAAGRERDDHRRLGRRPMLDVLPAASLEEDHVTPLEEDAARAAPAFPAHDAIMLPRRSRRKG